MLSESQERMLLVADRGREHEVTEVFAKWGLDAVTVGSVIAEPRLRILHRGELVADIPNTSLTDDAPRYHRPIGVWTVPVSRQPAPEMIRELNATRDFTSDLKKLLASSNICSKRWVYEQYDSMVQTNTVEGPGGGAGVMRIKPAEPGGTQRGLAMALDGNSRWCYLNPRLGAAHAVAEAARKVACTGATPVAATNCLNFGNPEKPEIMAQLSGAIDGIAEACAALGTPITGGNVSLYNETRGEAIYPTPVLGIVGILEDASKAVPAAFQQVGDAVLLIRPRMLASRNGSLTEFGSSEYAKNLLKNLWGAPPPFFAEVERSLHLALAELSAAGVLSSACSVSDGGLAVAMAEQTFANSIGVQADIPVLPVANEPNQTMALALFAEHASQVVVSCKANAVSRVMKVQIPDALEVIPLGATIADRVEITVNGQPAISASIADLQEPWLRGLSDALESTLSAEPHPGQS
jgi:phosphoribosylformylglycinamidine synthase II